MQTTLASIVVVVVALWAYFDIRTMLGRIGENLLELKDLLEAKKEAQDASDEMSLDEKLDLLKQEVRSYLSADDPEEWERRERWNWRDWEVSGSSGAEVEREFREKVPNLSDLPKDVQEALARKRETVRARRRQIEEQQRPEQERQRGEQPKYIENWIAQQPDEMLRQQFADGLLSYMDAENLIAATALDNLVGPAYQYHLCYVSSRDRLFGHVHHVCDKWETHYLPPNIYPAWHALKDKLPEGTERSFHEVFPCLLKGSRKPPNPQDGVGRLVYVAKLTVPVGPFRFERDILLGERDNQ